MLLHRHPMPKCLVESMESPCISCRKIAYLTIYRSLLETVVKFPLLLNSPTPWVLPAREVHDMCITPSPLPQ